LFEAGRFRAKKTVDATTFVGHHKVLVGTGGSICVRDNPRGKGLLVAAGWGRLSGRATRVALLSARGELCQGESGAIRGHSSRSARPRSSHCWASPCRSCSVWPGGPLVSSGPKVRGVPWRTLRRHRGAGRSGWNTRECEMSEGRARGTLIVAQQFDMRPNTTTGVITGAVYGSNQILSGKVFSTQWLLRNIAL
jgi:hypothetical protein